MPSPQELTLPDLNTRSLGRPTFHFPEVDSTQDLVRQMAAAGAPHGAVVLADHQYRGRGRQGRVWFSLPSPQLFFSVLLRPTLAAEKIPILNIAAALAVTYAVEAHGIVQPQVKWPNDIYLAGKKVGGILSEMIPSGETSSTVILGVGMNLFGSQDDFPDELRERATTLALHLASGKLLDRFRFLALTLSRLEELYEQVVGGDVRAIRSGFRDRWLYLNQEIQVKVGKETHTGMADEIDVEGALLLKVSEKGTVRVVSGEILPL